VPNVPVGSGLIPADDAATGFPAGRWRDARPSGPGL